MIPDKIFDILKWISIVALPALSTFIVVLGKIWNWGDIAPMVAQTITAVAVLLGALLGISTIQYNKEDKHELHGQVISGKAKTICDPGHAGHKNSRVPDGRTSLYRVK